MTNCLCDPETQTINLGICDDVKIDPSQLETSNCNGVAAGNSSVPLGAWFWFPGGKIPQDYMDISKDHGLLNRGDYPDLWKSICSGCNAISDAEYQNQITTNGCCGYFSSGDCTTTFRLPLIKGVYPRTADADDQHKTTGKYLNDAIRNIEGRFKVANTNGGIDTCEGAFYHSAGDGCLSQISTEYGGIAGFDASRVVPTADENRPKTICQTPIMKVKETAYSQVNSGIDYSLEEQWTGKHWIDGRKIYQKTINLGSLPGNTSKTVPHNITNYSRLISAESIYWDTNITNYVLPYIGGDVLASPSSITIKFGKDGIFLRSFHQAYANRGQVYSTIRYVCTDR